MDISSRQLRLGLAFGALLALGRDAAFAPLAARAADPSWRHRIVSGFTPVDREYGFDLEQRMNELGAQGYRLATVVQPRPPLVAEEATVILARDTTAPPAPVRFAVLTAPTATDLQTLAAARAAEGFVVKALTVTQHQFRPTSRRGDAIRFFDLSQVTLYYVAILERAPGETALPTRIVEAVTEPQGWDTFIAATRASFRVTQSLWLGPRTETRERERILFLLQDDGTGTAYETSVPATTPRTNLADHIERYQKRGFDVESVWSMRDRAEVLFSKPLGRKAAVATGSFEATMWNMDESLDVSGTGRFVGGGYVPEQNDLVRHFVQDRRVAGFLYDGVTGVFPRAIDDLGRLGGVGFVGLGAPPETEESCAACVALNERGQQGYRAMWAAVGPGYKFDRRMDVVMERRRP